MKSIFTVVVVLGLCAQLAPYSANAKSSSKGNSSSKNSAKSNPSSKKLTLKEKRAAEVNAFVQCKSKSTSLTQDLKCQGTNGSF